MTETPPEIAEMVRARLMALSGSERFVMGVRSFSSHRNLRSLSLMGKSLMLAYRNFM
jgi:hypothetical protein